MEARAWRFWPGGSVEGRIQLAYHIIPTGPIGLVDIACRPTGPAHNHKVIRAALFRGAGACWEAEWRERRDTLGGFPPSRIPGAHNWQTE